MDLEPPLIKKQSSEFDSALFKKDNDKLPSDEEDPYIFSSTSTSLIGLAIVFLMLGIPLLAIMSERPAAKKSLIKTSLDQNGPKSSFPFSFTWFSKSRC